MADYSTLEGKIEVLSKKVDNQARFTRGVVLLCTSAMLAVVFYTVTEIMSALAIAHMSVSENHYKVSHPGSAPSTTKSSK